MEKGYKVMDQFEFVKDIEIVMDLLDSTEAELAEMIGTSTMAFSRWRKGQNAPSEALVEAFYDEAFRRGVRLNKIKEQLYREECALPHRILFHGSKSGITGQISVEKSKFSNDLGRGFYCGESLEQSAMFVANYPGSSLYIMDFDVTGLTGLTFGVEQDWMLLIAYFRGKLGDFEEHPTIKHLLDKIAGKDYIVAPIADNRMFEIIDSFINGEITDVQCQHCLSATDLGKQYVLTSDLATSHLQILRHCYLAPAEKKFYLTAKEEDSRIGSDKVKLARRQYRNQGKYIEEILK